jgi:uncharacterized membrane protein
MDISGMFWVITAVTLFGIAFITVLVLGVIVWGIRRSSVVLRDPAEQQLRDRLARGEIDPAEYEARLDSLQEGDRKP